jgi:hypothetical protein
MGTNYDRPLKSAEKAVTLKRLRKVTHASTFVQMRSDLLEAPFCLFDRSAVKNQTKKRIFVFSTPENGFDNYQFNLG